MRGLPYDDLLLDGEVVVNDAEGKPSFSRLQRRGRILNEADALKASVELPAVYYAFDILGLEGYDLRSLPLVERKGILKGGAPERRADPLLGPYPGARNGALPARRSDAARGDRGQEGRTLPTGAVARRVGSRSAPCEVEDFVVVGWTEPKGGRSGFGSLHIAQYNGEDLVYRGSVGSGFRDAELDEVLTLLQEIEVDSSPCTLGPVPKAKETHWVRPEIVAEVKYKEFTDQGLARQPSFSRFRR